MTTPKAECCPKCGALTMGRFGDSTEMFVCRSKSRGPKFTQSDDCKIRQLTAERDAARAECERLRDKWAETGSDLTESLQEVSRENERLQAAVTEQAAELERLRAAKPTLEPIIKALKEASNERLKHLHEWRDEAMKWKNENDWYSFNFFEGMAAGANYCDIMYYRVIRVLEAALGIDESKGGAG